MILAPHPRTTRRRRSRRHPTLSGSAFGRLVAVVAAVALLGAACSDDDNPSESGDPSDDQSVRTEESADAEFVGEVEVAPDDSEATDPAGDVITVVIAPPEGETLQGTVVVTLEDVGLADRQAAILSEVRVSAAEVDQNQVAIGLPIPVAAAAAEISAAVHVDRDNDGAISSGDLLSTALIPVVGTSVGQVVVPVEAV